MSEKRRVFVVEDDAKIASVLADYLAASEYLPCVFRDGRTAIAAVHDDPPSAMILDLGLPGLDGLAVCQQLRDFSAIPILMLTARVDEVDRLAGYECSKLEHQHFQKKSKMLNLPIRKRYQSYYIFIINKKIIRTRLFIICCVLVKIFIYN